MTTTPTLTDAAATRVAAIAAKQAKPAILRLSVEGGGCSGFQYRFGLADTVEDDDSVSEHDGVKLVVDAVSLDLIARQYGRFYRIAWRGGFSGREPAGRCWLRLRFQLRDLN